MGTHDGEGRRSWSGAVLAIDRRLPMSVRRRVRYYRSHRRLLSLSHPTAFTEKVQWRMLYDHRDLLAPTCDKLAMKQAAAGVSDLTVPATYWAGTDVRELAGVDLPERWVLKPNHRFGLVEFGHARPDLPALERLTASWLEEPRSARGEWAYSRARRCLLVEEMIGDRPPVDYKVWVFDGVPRMVQVDLDRFGARRQQLYTPDWRPAGGGDPRLAPVEVPPPPRLEEMLRIATELGAPFDMMRVDLYDVGGRTWFGELTPYPGSGLQQIEPQELDLRLGSYWRLPRVA